MLLQMAKVPFFLRLRRIPYSISSFIHLSVEGHLPYFYSCKCCCEHWGARFFFQIHAAFVELLLRREILGFNGNSSSTYLPHTYKVPRTSLVAQTVKCLAYNVGDLGSIPGLGRSSGEGNGNPLQYSCLENPMDRGVWWATVHGVAKSRAQLSDFTSL